MFMVYDYWFFVLSIVIFVGKMMYDDCCLQYINGVVNQFEECQNCLQYYYIIIIVDLYDDCNLWYIIVVGG